MKAVVTLTLQQARALHEHLKATVPRTQSGQSDLERAHTALVDALCRARERAERSKP